MKRFATAAVAAATALSLSTGAAAAADFNLQDLGNYVTLAGAAQNGVSGPHNGSADLHGSALDSSSDEQKLNSSNAFVEFYNSSYESDIDNEWKAGTTADILWGVGIVAAIAAAGAAAVNAGLIPNVQLPF